MFHFLFLAAALSNGMASPGVRGDVVPYFDSLEAMAGRSDAVLVIRVDEHVEPRSLRKPAVNTGGFWSVEDCYVLKTIKGNVPESSLIRLRLFKMGVTAGPEGFDTFSSHIVFLKKRAEEPGKVPYESLKYDNCQIQVSPDCDPRPTNGKSLKETVAILVEQYCKYRDAKARREDEFFAKILK